MLLDPHAIYEQIRQSWQGSGHWRTEFRIWLSNVPGCDAAMKGNRRQRDQRSSSRCTILRATLVTVGAGILVYALRAAMQPALFAPPAAFAACPRDVLRAVAGKHTLGNDHPYTARPLTVFSANAPPWLRFEPNAVWGRPQAVILDVGCGNGWALLELAALYPQAVTTCANKAGYHWVQSESAADFASVALAHNISVPCDPIRGPHLPKVALMEQGVAFEDLPSHVAPEGGVDLLISMHAVNEGKVQANSTGAFLPRMLRVLRPGGTAAVMLSTLQDLPLERSLGDFDVIRVAHTKLWGRQFTILLYGRHGKERESPHIGLYARRCAEGDIPHTREGCLLSQPLDATRTRLIARDVALSAETLLPGADAIAAVAAAYLSSIAEVGADIRAAETRFAETRKVTDSPTYLASRKFRVQYLESLWGWFDSLPGS